MRSRPPPAGRGDRWDQMPAHPGRLAPAEPGTRSGSWSRGTPPARRPRDEIRAPDTLVDTIPCAIADVGSIPTVSTPTVRRFSFQIGTGASFSLCGPAASSPRTRVRCCQRAPSAPLPGRSDDGDPEALARAAGVVSAARRGGARRLDREGRASFAPAARRAAAVTAAWRRPSGSCSAWCRRERRRQMRSRSTSAAALARTRWKPRLRTLGRSPGRRRRPCGGRATGRARPRRCRGTP